MGCVTIVWRFNSPTARKSDTFAQNLANMELHKLICLVNFFSRIFPLRLRKIDRNIMHIISTLPIRLCRTSGRIVHVGFNYISMLLVSFYPIKRMKRRAGKPNSFFSGISMQEKYELIILLIETGQNVQLHPSTPYKRDKLSKCKIKLTCDISSTNLCWNAT